MRFLRSRRLSELDVRTMTYDSRTRRLYLGYMTYWGWVAIGKDGVPSHEFHLLTQPGNVWELAVAGDWARLYCVARGLYLCNFRPTTDGTGMEFFQTCLKETEASGSLQISPKLRKLYVLDGPGGEAVSVYPLAKDGCFTSVPRRFSIGPTALLRLDSNARRLYSFTDRGTIRSHPLDAEGYPAGSVEVFQVSCGEIRDALVDEPSGKVYVACTDPPKP